MRARSCSATTRAICRSPASRQACAGSCAARPPYWRHARYLNALALKLGFRFAVRPKDLAPRIEDILRKAGVWTDLSTCREERDSVNPGYSVNGGQVWTQRAEQKDVTLEMDERFFQVTLSIKEESLIEAVLRVWPDFSKGEPPSESARATKTLYPNGST